MAPREIAKLADNELAADIGGGRTSLWLLPGVSPANVSRLAKLHWENVWNFDEQIDFASAVRSSGQQREPYIISDTAADEDSFRASAYVRIYQPQMEKVQSSPLIRRIQIEQLKLRVSHIGGSLFVLGAVSDHKDDLEIIGAMAPQLRVCIVSTSRLTLEADKNHDRLYVWSSSLDEFIRAYTECEAPITSPRLLDLKDAKGIEVPASVLDELGPEWTLLTRDKIASVPVNQDSFDQFLNGKPEWNVYAAGGAYLRSLSMPTSSDSSIRKKGEFSQELLTIVRELDRKEIDPRDSMRQLIIYSEPGSGMTTFLRQLAVKTAQSGYPTLISNPLPRRLAPQSLGRVVGNLQDLWFRHRQGPGTGTGRIPVVIFLDKDTENVVEEKSIARSLASIGRELVLIRAFERSRDEMRSAPGAYLMTSDVEESELLTLGKHLRDFATRNALAPIPSDGEWKAYHQGIKQIARYSPVTRTTSQDELPHLFLIGISPFISERISDVNSLEQYFFQKWDALANPNIKLIVHTIAAAGVFSLSIPYNALRRHPGIDLSDLEKNSPELHRSIERFIEWRADGTNVQGWYLRIRHPVVGRLLCRAIDPVEGDVPYRLLLGILSELTNKPDDRWFAETLVFIIGRNFKHESPRFSLETDTPIQKAARAIFFAIPNRVKDDSRPIAHHEGRYHIHIIHACLDALTHPRSTTLDQSQIRQILDDEVSQSSEWLERALRIRNSFEPDSNVYNTYARLKFAYADSFVHENTDLYRTEFKDGVDLQEKAIEADPTNGISLYQFVDQIIAKLSRSDEDIWSADERLDLLSRAEARLSDLIKLHEENRWRNVDPVDAEVQLGTLVAKHLDTINKLPNLRDQVAEFRIRSPEAALRIMIRVFLGRSSFWDAFRDPSKAADLRSYRDDLAKTPQKTARGLLYLYRLFLDDPQGRLRFRDRLNVLTELKRKSRSEFLPFWHDEAALLCQLDNLPEGAQRFAEIRQFRSANESQWFWLNERVLLEPTGPARLRPLSITVVDPLEGWARLHNLNVRLKYQPQHFPAVARGQTFRAYIRFTIYGLQAVPQALANHDLAVLAAT